MRHALKPLAPACVLLLALPLALGGPRPVRAAGAPPDTLVVLSTTDLKGKTSPCGCHIPKGGFARIAAFLDSARAVRRATLYLDAGGFFPEQDGRTDLAEFMTRSLAQLGVGAIGVGPRDLRHGIAFLKDLVQRTGAPVTCANLADKRTRLPVFTSGRLLDVAGVKVGVFAIYSDRLDLGPAADSLVVLDPENAAQSQVTALRTKGAQVVILLAQMGRAGGEDLVSTVPGIDAVVLGHDIPVYEMGRRIGGTMASYAGEQGQHLGVIKVALSPAGKVLDEYCSVAALGPDVREQPAMFRAVKTFEDAYNERMRVEERSANVNDDDDPVDHFVGAGVRALPRRGGPAMAHDRALAGVGDAPTGEEGRHARVHPVPRRGLPPGRRVRDRPAHAAPRERPVRELPRHGHRARERLAHAAQGQRRHLPHVPQPGARSRVRLRRQVPAHRARQHERRVDPHREGPARVRRDGRLTARAPGRGARASRRQCSVKR